MKRYISILALGCAMIGAPALAADLPQRTAAPAPMLAPTPVYSWQGFYVGLSLGYAWENVAYNNFGATTNNFNPNGVIGGGYVGYNFQVAPSVVLGVEGDVEGGSVRQSVNPIALAIPLGSNVTLTNDFRASVRARAGIAMDRALLYATGGAAFGNFNLKSNWGNAFSEQWNVGRSGWTLGAGVEYAFTPNWIGRVEYRFTSFGNFSHFSPIVGPTTQRVNDNSVRAGIAYKFGGGYAPVVARY